MNIRDFSTGTIAELAAPVSAGEISAEAVSRNAAYTSGVQDERKQLASLLSQNTKTAKKKHGGGWRTPRRSR